jgi:hypothetical protein
MDNGHHNRYGDPPLLIGFLCTTIPFFVFPEDLTDVVYMFWGYRRSGTAMKKNEKNTRKKYGDNPAQPFPASQVCRHPG